MNNRKNSARHSDIPFLSPKAHNRGQSSRRKSQLNKPRKTKIHNFKRSRSTVIESPYFSKVQLDRHMHSASSVDSRDRSMVNSSCLVRMNSEPPERSASARVTVVDRRRGKSKGKYENKVGMMTAVKTLGVFSPKTKFSAAVKAKKSPLVPKNKQPTQPFIMKQKIEPQKKQPQKIKLHKKQAKRLQKIKHIETVLLTKRSPSKVTQLIKPFL